MSVFALEKTARTVEQSNVTDTTYSFPAKRIGPDALDLGRHLGGSPGELTCHSSRQIDHLNASALEADLI